MSVPSSRRLTGHFGGVGRSRPVSPLDWPLAKPDSLIVPARPEGGRSVAAQPEVGERPVIHFDNVTKMYPNQSRPALENVNIDVEKGEFVFLVGPSGSGKSTFLRLVLKEESPTNGKIQVAGKDLARLTSWKVPYMRRRIGCVFQDFRLLPNKNVYQNVAFALQVIGKPRRFIRKVVPEVVDLVGLEGKHDRMPDELSGGEQQRVAMARAFVNRPMILLADEPTGNIDPATSIGIMKVLDRINRTGTTVVMATHDAAIVDSMRKRVIELEYGKVVRDQSRGVYGQAY
jgi:cell division transport system ATP-binding protein